LWPIAPEERTHSAKFADVANADDVLDLRRLEETYGDDRAGIGSLLGMACESELRYIASLRDAIAKGDLHAVARAAHSIKGSASNIGAMKLSLVAAGIEDQARLDRWDGIADFAAELDRCYAEMRERVDRYCESVE
jgi:HPt (histidine-containing phosphotransfer) domain-containing protein